MRTLALCQSFLDRHADVIGDVVASGSKAELDAATQEAKACAAQQALGTRQRTGKAAVTRDAKRKLRQAMQPVAEVAKSKYQEIPGMMGLFMPPTSIATARLVAAAVAMAESSQAVSDTLIGAGLAPGVADTIRSRAEAVTEAATVAQQSNVQRAGATRGIRHAIQRGRRAIAVIDSLIVPTLEQSPDLLAAWKTAKRIPGKPGPVPTA